MSPNSRDAATFAPPIKCQGIKTRLTDWIRSLSAGLVEGRRWIEPFAGSCAVSLNLRPERALMCDSNPHLMHFYRSVQDGSVSPESVRRHLEAEGRRLLVKGEAHYYRIRERFNGSLSGPDDAGDPHDFLFLNRACFNGLIRFNRRGGFNVPFCRKPARYAPAYVTRIVNQVERARDVIRAGDWEFRCQRFEQSLAEAGADDLLYCDPPYAGRHTDYFNCWTDADEATLAAGLARSRAPFLLSTWHHNVHRHNPALEDQWSGYRILTRKHFYHVGARERNRHAMVEALVTSLV